MNNASNQVQTFCLILYKAKIIYPVYKAIIRIPQKKLTSDCNIPGIKSLHLNQISKYLVKLMSSMYAFYIFKTKHPLRTFQKSNFWFLIQLNFY